MPELWSVLQYSEMIEEFFTSSHILAEFLSQSRSETVLEKDGLSMDKIWSAKGSTSMSSNFMI